MQCRSSAALIGFYGDQLCPEEITKALGCEPSIGVRKGDSWTTKRGATKVATTGSWRIAAETVAPENLNGQLRNLLAGMTNDLDVWQSFASRYRAVAYCGLWLETFNDGIELAPDVLLALGQRGLCVDLDIYAQDDE